MGPNETSRRGLLRLAAGATLGGVALSSRAARADSLADIRVKGEIVCATSMQFPPFDYRKDGEFAGIDRELIDLVAKELGVKVTVQDLPWTSILPGLDAGKFDLCIAPVTVTIERAKRYAFTVPIAEATAALMRKAGDTSITKPQDLAGKTVGGQKGSAQLAQFKDFAATLSPAPIIREYVDNNQAYADLAAGRLDAAANSLPNIAYAAAQRPDTFAVVLPPFGQATYFSWVGRLGDGDAALVAAVSAALVKLDGDGQMAAIQKKFFGEVNKLPTVLPVPTV